MTSCAKYEIQQRLGIPVENPCGKPRESSDGFPPHTPPFQEDLSLLGPLVDSIGQGLELIVARVEALEQQVEALFAILDEPLSPTESIQRLRELREQMV